MPAPLLGSRRDRRSAAVLGASLLAAVTLAATAATPAAASPRPLAEPDTATLAGALRHQQVEWGPCAFTGLTPEQDDRFQAVPGLACATITVPRDWHDPADGHTFQVRVSKTATAGAARQGIALVNPGGPGGAGLHWGAAMATMAPALAHQYDFVGFDPRGVGDSTRVPCTVTIDSEVVDSYDEETEAYVRGCEETPGTEFITTEQTAYDMDFIRVLLGERKTSYIGYSYGTWLGTWYAATFPGKVHRMLLDSSTDVSEKSLQRTWDLQPYTRDRAFQEQLLPYVARRDDFYGLGADPMAIRRAWEEAGGTRTFTGQIMFAWFILPALYDTSTYEIAGAAVNTVVLSGQEPATEQVVRRFVDEQLARPALAADLRGVLLQAREGALGAIAKGPARLPATADVSTFEVDYTFELIRCQDGQWNQSHDYWKKSAAKLLREAPLIGPFMQNVPACAFFRTDNRMPKPNPRTFPQVLVVQSEMDAATAYEGALDTAKHLPGAKMISVDNEGTHGVFPYLTSCVDAPVHAYFHVGLMPDDRFTACQALPLPGEAKTFEVGGTIGPKGAIKVETVTDDMRRAAKMVKRLLAQQALEPETAV
ncbi:alpha/beta fold hydrolase [Saccharothrix xinjiangensis]|uniref:Alpha/beta fold hydrolase n=1 Tax=Saccharothrix xinjiangensis TaxID=204798 RepID=A0ABV9YFS4_9PSEU